MRDRSGERHAFAGIETPAGIRGAHGRAGIFQIHFVFVDIGMDEERAVERRHQVSSAIGEGHRVVDAFVAPVEARQHIEWFSASRVGGLRLHQRRRRGLDMVGVRQDPADARSRVPDLFVTVVHPGATTIKE